jgi:hypothetical protein
MIHCLSSAHLIGLFAISFLLNSPVASGINWNGNWAMSCDFRGNDLSSVQIPGELCGTKCANTNGCTHFSWTNWNGGTCWMKSGSVSKSNAVSISDSSSVCGVLTDNPAPGGNNGDIISEEKFRCVFPHLDDETRRQRFDGLRQSGWKPRNVDEAAVFLAHVHHETDGLKAMTEYCAPGMFHVTVILVKKIATHISENSFLNRLCFTLCWIMVRYSRRIRKVILWSWLVPTFVAMQLQCGWQGSRFRST